jgi:hypothetical protein
MLGRAIAAGAVAALAFAGVAGAAEGPRQTYTEVFTTDVPGASTGRTYAIDYLNPQSPGAKPHAFSHLRIELAEGARFNTDAVPHCNATDAQIVAQGPSACPPESRVGSDETVVDTGVEGPNRYFTTDFSFFNDDRELILVADTREYGARIVIRAQIGERTLDIENPPIPGTPPDGGAAKSQRGRFEVRPGYITTPPTCPPSGYWVNRLFWTYRDGVEQTAESRSPCRRADTARPKISAFGVPRPCASRRFRMHVRIADESRLRSAEVLLDGRRIATSVHKRLSARVDPGALRSGRHGLTVMATDAAGNTAARTFRLNRCAR